MCLDISRGKFSVIVNDGIEELGDMVRRRNIERGLEKLMDIYYEVDFSTEGQVMERKRRLSFPSWNKLKCFSCLFVYLLICFPDSVEILITN